MKNFSEEALAYIHLDWYGKYHREMVMVLLEMQARDEKFGTASYEFGELESSLVAERFSKIDYAMSLIDLYGKFCKDPEEFKKWCLSFEPTETQAHALCGLIHLFSRAEKVLTYNNGSWHMGLTNLNFISKNHELYFFVMYFLVKQYEKYEDELMVDEMGGDGICMGNYKLHSILMRDTGVLSETINDYLEQLKSMKSICVRLLENKVVAKTYLELASAYAKAVGKESMGQYFYQFVGYSEASLALAGEQLAKEVLMA